MIVTKEVLVIHPAWMIMFLLCYAIAFYVYYRTCNLFTTVASLLIGMVGTTYIIYLYHGLL